jgi:hypothetical protein
MKDVTSTSFGLLIAFLLPGLVGFYSLTYWSTGVTNVFNTFLTASSNVGLFFLVISGGLVIGLQVTLIRWLVYERLLCKSVQLKPSDFVKLGADESKLNAFRAAADEQYRYHQFWGGMSIVLPILFVGWFSDSLCALSWLGRSLAIAAFLLIELLTIYGAKVGFELYVTRAKQILKGN